MTQTSPQTYSPDPAANYERYFVPAIGAPLARDLVELAQLRPGEHVVDVACGTGIVTRLAAERVDGGTVAGVDINPAMLLVARDAVDDIGVEWYEASAEALPLDDAVFDVALCQMGLQFFSDRLGALAEIRRVIRPSGRVVLNVPGPTPPVFRALEEVLRQWLGPEAGRFVATVFSLHDREEIRTLVNRAGFADVEVRSRRKRLVLPRAEDFLWEYAYSTPLAEVVSRLHEHARAELQQDVVSAWEKFTEADSVVLEIDVTSAVGGTPARAAR
jgi:ubiquinone/menaquinone biosynthesis C-methylase UbiE